MSIRRAPRPQNRFTIIANTVFSGGLSFRATGLLAYLLSKPDDWTVSVAELVKHSAKSSRPEGRDAIYAMLKELIAAGYVVRAQARDDQGKMDGSEYVVYDLPRKPLPENPDAVQSHAKPSDLTETEKPYADNPTLLRTDTNKGLTETKPLSAPAAQTVAKEGIPEGFAEFWALYPTYRHASKKTALTAFPRSVKRAGGRDRLMAALRAQVAIWPADGAHPKAQIVPMASTWLNKDRWDDPISSIETMFRDREHAPRMSASDRALSELHDEITGKDR